MTAPIFLSHARGDRESHRFLAIEISLRRSEIDVWSFDQDADEDRRTSFLERWREEVKSAVELAPAVVLIWSQHALTSFNRFRSSWNDPNGFPDGELIWEAWSASRAGKLLIVSIDKTPPTEAPSWLQDWSFIDLSGFDANLESVAFAQLLAALRRYVDIRRSERLPSPSPRSIPHIEPWTEIDHGLSPAWSLV